MKIFLTGSNGFIGTAVQRQLSKDEFEVIKLPRVILDNPKSFAELIGSQQGPGKDGVLVHCAWNPVSVPGYRNDPGNTFSVVQSTNLAKNAQKLNLSLLALGTHLESKQSETDVYVESKRMAIANIAEILTPDSFCWLQLHYVFSPDEGRPQVIKAALDARNRDIPFSIDNPNRFHDFIEVRDVAKAISMIIREKMTGIRELGSGETRSVQQLVGKSFPTLEIETPSQMSPKLADKFADVKYLRDIGWEPVFTNKFFGT